MPNLIRHWRTQAITLGVGAIGVAAFIKVDLPLPWLLGPLFACLVAAICGLNLKGIRIASESMRTVLGVAVGASITAALLARLDTMLLSIMLIPPFVIAIGLIGYPYFRRICGYDRATAFYSAMPGGLSDMLLFGESAGGNLRSMSLIQVTRVLVIVAVLPFILDHGFGLDLSQLSNSDHNFPPVSQLAIMLFCAAVGWWGGIKIGLFGPAILGPLILAAIASVAGWLTVRPPADLILAAQFFIGLHVGATYTGITTRELRHDITAALGYCVLIAAISAAFCGLIIAVNLAPLVETLLAFSPGGQAEMALLALVVGADVAHVITHHLIRILVVIFGAPLFFRFFK